MVFRSLRTKFMILFFCFFFIPYALLSLLSISASREMMRRSTIEHLQNLVEVKETAIEQWLNERVSHARTLAQSPEVKSLDPEQIASCFALFKHLVRAYREIWVYDLTGKVVSGAGEATRLDKGFERALNGKPLILTSAVEEGNQPSQAPVTVLFGIKSPAGRPIGVLKAVLDLSYVSGLIAEAHLGQTGEFFLVGRDGALILHRRPAASRQGGRPKVVNLGANGFQPVFTGVYRDGDGREVLGSRKWVEGLQCYLVAEQETREAFRQTSVLTHAAVLIFLVSSGGIFAISYWVLGRATRPIKHLSETVASFADGHFEKPVSTRRGDEIGRLIAGFNAMSWKLQNAYEALHGKVEASDRELEVAYRTLQQKQEELVRSEKMAALGQLSAGLAHEIRNPLTSFKLFIQSLEAEVELTPNQMEDFAIIAREIERMNENLNRFLNFARPEEPVFKRIDLGALAKETACLVGTKFRSNHVRVEILVPDDLPTVEGDPKQLTQVLLNLYLNAIEAMPEGGVLKIAASVKRPEGKGEVIELSVGDTGEGIREEDRPYLFDPFFTTKSAGTGLGLSIVYSIVLKHNAHVEVESEPGKGSTFRLLFPVPSEAEWKGSWS